MLAVVALLTLCGCQKRCACSSFNGMVYYYTPEEVENMGVSCSGMAIQANTRYYSMCEWE